MAQKKENPESGKPGVKVQDLAPKKDAKGGARVVNAANPDGFSTSSTGLSGVGKDATGLSGKSSE